MHTMNIFSTWNNQGAAHESFWMVYIKTTKGWTSFTQETDGAWLMCEENIPEEDLPEERTFFG